MTEHEITCQRCGARLRIRYDEGSVSCLGGKHFASRQVSVIAMPTSYDLKLGGCWDDGARAGATDTDGGDCRVGV